MPRIARMIVKGEPAVYHIMSRTALAGYIIGDVEKEFLLNCIKRLSSIYFTEVLGFCLMGNHFHLLVRVLPGEEYSDAEIKRRFRLLYRNNKDKKDHKLSQKEISDLRKKWGNLSEFAKDIKQTFSRYFNRLHKRKGFFWSERFKSVIVDSGETLINCLAYIDLNPVRAGLVEKPEDYRWCSLGYHVQSRNKDQLLSLDFGLKEFGVKSDKERLRIYRRFVHGKGSLKIREIDQLSDFELGAIEKFRYRTRYFSDSGIIGTKAFISRHYQVFKHHFSSKHKKKPKTIPGLAGVYSLKRLAVNA